MAVFPCLNCFQRFPGEATNLYLSHYLGDASEKYRFVVCPGCAESLLSEWRRRALYRDDGGDWAYAEPTDEPKAKMQPLADTPEPSKPPGGVQSRSRGSRGL